MKKITASAAGSEVVRLLRAGGPARVIGVTSRGVYAMTPEKDVFFISGEQYRSPITICLGNRGLDLPAMEMGDDLSLHPDGVTLRRGELFITVEGLEPWVSDPPPEQVSDADTRRIRIERLMERAVAAKPDAGFSPSGAMLVLKKVGHIAPENRAAAAHIEEILRLNTRRDLAAILEEIAGLPGFGRGLTPSGDDFIIGFLLAANRWGRWLGYDPQGVEELNKGMIQSAEDKTTSLSCSFIRQAAQGSGDERYLEVVDGIMTGSPGEDICLRFILETGNSSGIDTFLGMAAGIL